MELLVALLFLISAEMAVTGIVSTIILWKIMRNSL